MALHAISSFQGKILQGMRSEGLQVRKILRVYPPYDIGDLHEVLFVSMDRKAGTCFVDANGKLQHGPFSGFGV